MSTLDYYQWKNGPKYLSKTKLASPPKMSKFIKNPKSDQEGGISSEMLHENDKENDKPETNFLQVVFFLNDVFGKKNRKQEVKQCFVQF